MNSDKSSNPIRIHFWSSTEYAGFLAGLMREMNEYPGISAEQRYTISESSYRRAHSWWARKWLRVRQYILYPLHLAYALIGGREADVVVVCTNTFYAPLLATFLHQRVIHLVYDLYPEALVHAGKMSGKGRAARIIHWLTQLTFERAESNVFLGERLRAYAAKTYTLRNNCTVIPVGADDSLFPPDGRNPVQDGDPPTILYCGNLGHMHDVDTVFGAWEILKQTKLDILWRFQSVGPRHNELLDTVKSLEESALDISVGPGLPQNEWIRVMQASRVALVTMIPGSEEVVMPSKSYSALAAGQAILAVAPKTSDLVAMIEKHQCGWWVEPGDAAGLVRSVEHIAADDNELQRRQENAKRAAGEHYSQQALSEQWLELIR